jgi:hypothetical protein
VFGPRHDYSTAAEAGSIDFAGIAIRDLNGDRRPDLVVYEPGGLL